MKKLKVLSLFNGMNCIGMALKSAGFEFELYASEIDKHANKISSLLFPETINLGDVRTVKISEIGKIDLLVAGSPCQGFSFAGKQLNFEDERSKLFFEFIRILKEARALNPEVKFLLENVKMKAQHQAVISRFCAIDPIEINSSLLSAQNRKRLYWTNIGTTKNNLFGIEQPGIKQPKDKRILLKDILENEVEEKYFLSEKVIESFKIHKQRHKEKGNGFGWTEPGDEPTEKANCLITNQKQSQNQTYIKTDRKGKKKNNQNKANCLTVAGNSGGNHSDMDVLIVPSNTKKNYVEVNKKVKVRKNEVDIKGLQKLLKKHKKGTNKKIAKDLNIKITTVEHWFRTDNYFCIPDPEIWPKLKEYLNVNTDVFDNSIMQFIEKDGNFDQANRVYNTNNKGPCLTTAKQDNCIFVPESTKKVLSADYRLDEGLRCRKNGKSASLMARGGLSKDITGRPLAIFVTESTNIRRLTPRECCRLQTIPEEETNKILNSDVSDTQIYKMLGNGWTVEVIAYILKHMK